MIFVGNNKKNIIAFAIFILIALMFFSHPSFGATESNYYSVHQLFYSFWYTDSNGNYHEKEVSNYKDAHNLYDNIIRCYSVEDCPETEEFTFYLSLDYPSLSLFRTFVPPGTKSIKFFLLNRQDVELGYAVRYGTIPTYEPSGGYEAVPWEDDDGAKLPELKETDYLAPKASGHVTLVSHSSMNLIQPEGEAGWIYVKQLFGQAEYVGTLLYTVVVDTAVFKQWYDGMAGPDGKHDTDDDLWDLNDDPPIDGATVSQNRPPVITLKNTNRTIFEVSESAIANTAVGPGTISITDPEDDILTYTITYTRTADLCELFAYDTTTETIIVTEKGASNLNYQTQSSYNLTLTATEAYTSEQYSSAQDISINLIQSNNAPTITNQADWEGGEYYINENALGSLSHADSSKASKIVASDPDGDTNLAYSTTDQNIQIGATDGTVEVINSFNFEDTALITENSKKYYTFDIIVKDSADPPGTATATGKIEVKDVNEKPILNEIASITIDEHLSDGTVIMTISAKDPDGNALEYWFIDTTTTPETRIAGYSDFLIDQATGNIVVNSNGDFHYEGNETGYELIVQAVEAEGGKLFSEMRTFTIGLRDVKASVLDETFYAMEPGVPEQTIGAVPVIDLDTTEGKVYAYEITGGTGMGLFSVNSPGGISEGYISLNAGETLDYETTPQYTLEVRVSEDNGVTVSDPGIITIAVTDMKEDPVINAQTFTYDLADLAQEPPNYSVGTVQVTNQIGLDQAISMLQAMCGIPSIDKSYDLNGDQKIGHEDVLYILQGVSGIESRSLCTYAFDATDLTTAPYSYFSIDKMTGEISLALDDQNQPLLPTDPLPTEPYQLNVKVTDAYGIEATGTITIEISDSSAT